METIKMHNPFTGKSWEVAEPDPALGLPDRAVWLIEEGKEPRLVSRSAIGSLELEGTGWMDPELRKYDYNYEKFKARATVA